MLSVIVADDEETIRNGLVRLIERCALDLEVVATAENGQQAVELCQKYRPRIVLMDINMPGMTGLDAIAAIRAGDPEVKIIIISGYGQFEYAQRALTLGVFNYLLKPVDYRDFKDILQKAMDALVAHNILPPPDLGTQVADYLRG
ncbi:MAG: response regulator, partial [Pseudoflavonifractor sp.]